MQLISWVFMSYDFSLQATLETVASRLPLKTTAIYFSVELENNYILANFEFHSAKPNS